MLTLMNKKDILARELIDLNICDFREAMNYINDHHIDARVDDCIKAVSIANKIRSMMRNK